MAELSKLYVAIGAKTAEFSKGMDKIEGRMQQASRKMKIAGTVMIGAVAAVGGASLKMAADFDSAMREVNTMMLLNEEEFAEFSQEVRGLAKHMGVDAVKAANALYQAISAGVPKDNAIEFLAIATKAAIGGVTDTTTAVDGLTTVINAFKMPMSDAQKVADIMFTTVKGGKTTFEELSASMFNVAPIAASLNVKFETVSAALATMTKQGVPTAQATTQLRQAMVALTKPTKDMQAAIEALGYASGQAMLEELGFAETINILRDATAGNNEQLMKMFGSVEAGSAILALTGENAQMFAADIAAMADSAGAAEDAFDQMEKTTARKFEKLQAQFKDAAMTLGNALMPALTKLLDIITPIIGKIGAWIEKHPKLSAGILATVGAVGGLLVIAGPLLNLFKGMAAVLPMITGAMHSQVIALIAHKVALIASKVAMGLATAAQWLLNVAMSANPIGLVIAIVVALIAIVVLLVKKWDWVKEKALAIWEAIKGFFKRIGEAIKNIFLNMTPVGLIIKHWDKIKAKASQIWNGIKGFFSKIGDSIKNKFKSTWEDTKNAVGTIWDRMTANSERFGGGLKGKILSAMEATGKGVKRVLERMGIDTGAITDRIRSIWDRVVDFFRRIPEKIGRAFSKVKDIILAPFRFAMRGLERAINWLIRQANKISVTVPDWVPLIGGKTFGFNIPEISLPSFHKGGMIREPTLLYGLKSMTPYAIAEKGEEVRPAGTAEVVNNFNIAELVVREEADIQRIARELYRLQRSKEILVGT